jgi:hypothetical protein
MADQWYYARGEEKLGPFSARLLKDLANAGGILPTDTVWKEGIEKGVSAARVKNLLPPAPAHSSPVDLSPPKPPPPPSPPPTEAQSGAALVDPGAETSLVELPPPVAAPEDAAQAVGEEPAPSHSPPSSQLNPPKKGRAVAVKGAVLISQDGQAVHYRKKCCTCGHEDACRNRMPIRHGLTRATYFCPKCRKLSPMEIQGMM